MHSICHVRSHKFPRNMLIERNRGVALILVPQIFFLEMQMGGVW